MRRLASGAEAVRLATAELSVDGMTCGGCAIADAIRNAGFRPTLRSTSRSAGPGD